MALEVIRTTPVEGDYTSLEDHQAQTPGTFFGGKPVLHYHAPGASLSIAASQLSSNAAFSQLIPSSSSANTNGESTSSSDSETTIPNIDIWVTSSNLVLFSPTTSIGVQISYPAISLHALQATSVYMQLSLNDSAYTADEDLETLEVLLTPSSSNPSAAETTASPPPPSQALFAALSACADLHPDPDQSDDEAQDPMILGGGGGGGGGGGVGLSSMPGASGWITSENMHEFMDEDGNLRIQENGGQGSNGVTVIDAAGDSGDLAAGIGGGQGFPGGSLGAGAGRTRRAEEFEDAEVEANGQEEGYSVDAEGDETKWRRTG